MRTLLIACLAALVGGCATERVVTPRQYLDEQTAATITVVADPWVFNRQGSTPQLDFIDLYAIDVNRTGEHRQYLVIVQYWPGREWSSVQPTLEIHAGDERVLLPPSVVSPRELGIAQRFDSSAPRSARRWFYPVDPEHLARIARTQHTSIALVNDELRSAYVVWRDGSAELSEFATLAFD